MMTTPEASAHLRWDDLRTKARAMCDGQGGCTLGPDVQSLATGPDDPSMVTIRTCVEHCANCMRGRMAEGHPDDVQLNELKASNSQAGEASFVIGSFQNEEVPAYLSHPVQVVAS